MNELRRFEFYSQERRDPYVEHLIEYKISEQDGHIHFNGYYYVLDEEFPKRVFFVTTLRDEKPYEEEITENEGYRCSYKILEEEFYEIEIINREKFKNTSSWDEVDDEDGSKMRICYFPTHEQKINFKIITKFEKFEDFLKRTSEYFKQEQVE
jgi:hypothetical protein